MQELDAGFESTIGLKEGTRYKTESGKMDLRLIV